MDEADIKPCGACGVWSVLYNAKSGLCEECEREYEQDDFEPDYVGEAREEAANDPSPGWMADSRACGNEP
jgi:hypothetical protein